MAICFSFHIDSGSRPELQVSARPLSNALWMPTRTVTVQAPCLCDPKVREALEALQTVKVAMSLSPSYRCAGVWNAGHGGSKALASFANYFLDDLSDRFIVTAHIALSHE